MTVAFGFPKHQQGRDFIGRAGVLASTWYNSTKYKVSYAYEDIAMNTRRYKVSEQFFRDWIRQQREQSYDPYNSIGCYCGVF